jgi:hypothetical protein
MATLAEVVEQFQVREKRLKQLATVIDTSGIHMKPKEMEEVLFEIHTALTEFTERVLLWMEAREAGIPATAGPYLANHPGPES